MEDANVIKKNIAAPDIFENVWMICSAPQTVDQHNSMVWEMLNIFSWHYMNPGKSVEIIQTTKVSWFKAYPCLGVGMQRAEDEGSHDILQSWISLHSMQNIRRG